MTLFDENLFKIQLFRNIVNQKFYFWPNQNFILENY